MSETPFTITTIAPHEAEILVASRRHMYEDMGETNAESLERAGEIFRSWLADRVADGRVRGYVARDEDGEWLGALTAQLQETQPSLGNPSARQYYVFGLWVRPEARRRGVATALVSAVVEQAKAEGIGMVSLHASEMGRLVYEKMGFEPGVSMRLFLDPLP